MNLSVKEIENEALQLPAGERERLASNLFNSIHNTELNETDEAWLSIAEDRYEALISGKDKGIKESEFFETLNESLKWI